MNCDTRILLCLMPFWPPLTPPLGISVLKSYLAKNGFSANTHDFNVDKNLWGYLNKYFNLVKQAVPENKYGNFNMISFDVLGNHLTAFIHKKEDDNSYMRLVEILFRKNFFCGIDSSAIRALDRVLAGFYGDLQDSILESAKKYKPTVFGVSTLTTSLGPSLFALRLIKERFPETVTFMGGGAFADQLFRDSPNFENLLECTKTYVDVIITGEGELLFSKYLTGELEHGKRFYTLDDIDGSTVDLGEVDIPDFSDFELKSYVQMALYASRSCPFQCKFCSETIQWGPYRKKGITQIVEEIKKLHALYGGKLFLFGDSIIQQIITPLARNLLSSKTEVFWDGYIRADPIACNPDNTDLWRKGGYYRARLGIESGSQHVLDIMNKKITVRQIRDALSALAGSGIKTTTYWVVGYPGETEADFKETISLLSDIRDTIYEADWHPFYYFPCGQVNSQPWRDEYDIELLYPEEFTDMLVAQTWILKADPTREEMYARLQRFGETCKSLNIPNPYSLVEIYNADKRWKHLHPKAGPNIFELHNKNYIP